MKEGIVFKSTWEVALYLFGIENIFSSAVITVRFDSKFNNNFERRKDMKTVEVPKQ